MKSKIIFILIMGLIPFSIIFADSPSPYYLNIKDLDIQGAKKVSEGGYFYFKIRNLENIGRNIKIYFDEELIFENKSNLEIWAAWFIEVGDAYAITIPLTAYGTYYLHFHAPIVNFTREYAVMFVEGKYETPFWIDVLDIGLEKEVISLESIEFSGHTIIDEKQSDNKDLLQLFYGITSIVLGSIIIGLNLDRICQKSEK